MQRMSGRINTNWLVAALIVAAIVAAIVAILKLDITGRGGSGLSDAYEYDLRQLAKIDPNLILYAQSGPVIRTGLSQSRAIVLDANDRIYVAGDEAIRVFNAVGDVEGTIGLSGEPQCLMVSDDGTIYLGMRDHVEVLSPEGRVVASWEPLGDEAVLTSIARQGDAVLVADAGHRIVLLYDTAGTLVDHIGGEGPGPQHPGLPGAESAFRSGGRPGWYAAGGGPGPQSHRHVHDGRRPGILVG